MSYKYGVVHASVKCEDCSWEAKSYKNAQATGKIHAKRYGHKVSGDLGISFCYDYREGGTKQKMSKFKVGDLVCPSAEAKAKGIKFNKNAVFPWEVMRVRSPTVWLQRFSKIASSRIEIWHEDFFELWKTREETEK
jgi:hypothetical protein